MPTARTLIAAVIASVAFSAIPAFAQAPSIDFTVPATLTRPATGSTSLSIAFTANSPTGQLTEYKWSATASNGSSLGSSSWTPFSTHQDSTYVNDGYWSSYVVEDAYDEIRWVTSGYWNEVGHTEYYYLDPPVYNWIMGWWTYIGTRWVVDSRTWVDTSHEEFIHHPAVYNEEWIDTSYWQTTTVTDQLSSGTSSKVLTISPTTPLGAVTVTFWARDAAGRSSTLSHTTSIELASTVTWASPASITYGTPLSATQLNASADTAGTFVYSPAAGTVLNTGAASLSVTFTPTDAITYATATKSVTLTVNPAPLTITANDAVKSVGASSPTFSASYLGLVNGDTAAAVGGLVLSTTATIASPPGVYPITPSGASASNYAISYVNGALTVSGSAQTVTLSAGVVSVGAGQTGLMTATPGTPLSFAASAGSTGLYTWAVDGVVQGTIGATVNANFAMVGPHSVSVFAAAGGDYAASPVATIEVVVSTAETWTVATGVSHLLALRSDHTVATWGGNTFGQLGDGTTLSKSGPAAVSGLTDIVAIAAGDYHSLAVTSGGSVWGWGRNDAGQLSAAAATAQSVPVSIAGFTGIIQMAAGTAQSLALKDDGTLWALGANGQGQLGDGSTTARSAPVQVLTNVLMVAAGAEHSVALKADGSVWAWGRNDAGQVGDGSTSNRLTPVQVVGLSDIVAVAAAGDHTLALESDGTVWGWGMNSSGELGDGTTSNRSAPVAVSGLLGVIELAAGRHHSVALDASGAVWTWGRNDVGQIGDGTATNRAAPVQVNEIAGIAHVAAGGDHTAVVRSDGTLWVWGGDGFAQASLASAGITQMPIRLISSGDDTDADGMLDSLEFEYFGGLGHSGAEDTDGDGLTDVQEIFLGSSPLQADTDGDSLGDAADSHPTDYFNDEVPTLAKLGGDNQTTPADQFNPAPLDLAVFNSAGSGPLVNAPVTFTVTQGGGMLATTNTGNPQLFSSLTVRTDEDGTVQAYYKQPTLVGTMSVILAAAGTADVEFETQSGTALDLDNDGLLDSWELEYFGTLVHGPDGDPDFDGLTNAQELAQGTNPLVVDSAGGSMPSGGYSLVIKLPNGTFRAINTSTWEISSVPGP